MLIRTLADLCAPVGLSQIDAGNLGRARVWLSMAAGLHPRKARVLYDAACRAAAIGEGDEVAHYCEGALRADPSFAEAHGLLRDTFLEGEDYFYVLREIHQLLRPRTYVEIGVARGASISLAAPETAALGVDPEPQIAGPLSPNTRIFSETSDAFFRRDVRAELGGRAVDLAFIDGMHHFDVALRDFVNLERLCGPHSVILIHDCFPHDRITAERERRTEFWSGDVWRLILLLKKYRPDLSIHTLATPPTGLGIVRRLDPSSDVLTRNMGRATAEFMALDYGCLARGRAAKLNLVSNDADSLRRVLMPT